MRTVITAIICFSWLLGSAQKSDKKQKEVKDNLYTCTYMIDKKTKSKEGEYLKKKNNTNDTLVTGQYQNDRKVGLWKYRSAGNKDYILYNYDRQSAEYLDPSFSKVDSFLIIEPGNGLFFLNKVDSPPIYIGFKGEVKSVIDQNISVPIEETARGIEGVSAASFIIDRTGKISEIKIERSLSRPIDKVLLNAIKMLDGDWIPAKVNNIPTDAKMNVLFHVSNSKRNPKSKEKPYEIAINRIYYGWVQKTYSTGREISVPVSSPMGGARNTF